MTSRDHLLGWPGAAAHSHRVEMQALWEADIARMRLYGADIGDDPYPLGIPRRVEAEGEAMIRREPTLAGLLPTGDQFCTAGDDAGILRRGDIGRARILDAVQQLGAALMDFQPFEPSPAGAPMGVHIGLDLAISHGDEETHIDA